MTLTKYRVAEDPRRTHISFKLVRIAPQNALSVDQNQTQFKNRRHPSLLLLAPVTY